MCCDVAICILEHVNRSRKRGCGTELTSVKGWASEFAALMACPEEPGCLHWWSASHRRPPSPVIISKNMLFEADKVMFEIYRETEYTGRYRVVYFTELQDHNKESEINHALAGEHFYDGFIKNYKKDEAKQIIESLLVRLNNGEQLEPQEVERALGDHAAG
jgi:hypothetical protein